MGLHAHTTGPVAIPSQFPHLGRYQLLSRLAVGGMAEVYLARHGELSGFKTLVVIKRVLPHLAENPDFIAMFLDEARIASMLDHPNIVRISEVGRVDNEYFLVMELVQGKPLSSLLRRIHETKVPLPQKLSALIISQAAGGLHHAHCLTDAAGQLLGLVHRDVSPQNVMISFEGQVKVIDFGIARALGRIADTNTRSLKGKMGYMAPEQARSEPVDARADIFGLGVSLWELLAGKRLFLRETDIETLQAVVMENIPELSDFATVDPQLNAIVKKALMRDRNGRYQSGEELRRALEGYIFSAGGASNYELASLMKEWFSSDYREWQRAARLALDMEDNDPPLSVHLGDVQGTPSTQRIGLSFTRTPVQATPMPVYVPPAHLLASMTHVTEQKQGFVQGLLDWFKTPWKRLTLVSLIIFANTVVLGVILIAPKPAQVIITPASPGERVRPKVDLLPSTPAPVPVAPIAPAVVLATEPVQVEKKRPQRGKKKAILGAKSSRSTKSAKAGKKSGGNAPLRPNPF